MHSLLSKSIHLPDLQTIISLMDACRCEALCWIGTTPLHSGIGTVETLNRCNLTGSSRHSCPPHQHVNCLGSCEGQACDCIAREW